MEHLRWLSDGNEMESERVTGRVNEGKVERRRKGRTKLRMRWKGRINRELVRKCIIVHHITQTHPSLREGRKEGKSRLTTTAFIFLIPTEKIPENLANPSYRISNTYPTRITSSFQRSWKLTRKTVSVSETGRY